MIIALFYILILEAYINSLNSKTYRARLVIWYNNYQHLVSIVTKVVLLPDIQTIVTISLTASSKSGIPTLVPSIPSVRCIVTQDISHPCSTCTTCAVFPNFQPPPHSAQGWLMLKIRGGYRPHYSLTGLHILPLLIILIAYSSILIIRGVCTSVVNSTVFYNQDVYSSITRFGGLYSLKSNFRLFIFSLFWLYE